MSIKHISAQQAYFNYVASGKADFDRISECILNRINHVPNNSDCEKRVLAITVAAYESYLDNTLCGTIQRVFQKIVSFFGGKSNLNLAKYSLHLPNYNFAPDVEIKVEKSLAEYLACEKGKTLFFSSGTSAINPATILIANPRGDVYEFQRGAGPKGSGVARSFYEGTLRPRGKKPKPVGILTTMPQIIPNKIREDEIAEVRQATQGMKQEKDTLDSLQGHMRVIGVHDHFSAKMGKLDVGFTIMDYHRHSDIHTFLKSETYEEMTELQKLTFMDALIDAFQQLHALGFIHRDVKSKNILIDKNFLPVLIDFEACIHESDEAEKQNVMSTMAWWSPEYVDACLQGMEDANQTQIMDSLTDIKKYVPAATTQAMDAWALGLVLFNFFFGEDLISDLLGFTNLRGSQKYMCQSLKDILEKQLPEFIAQMNAEGDPTNESWVEIKKAIDQNRGIWENIILPLLELEATKRKKTSDISMNHVLASEITA